MAMDRDRGVTLVETMIAFLIAVIIIVGLGNLVFQATVVNKNQGSEVTRAVVYAQDKMEKLLSLAAYKLPGTGTVNFADCISTTSMPAICNVTNITDTGWTTGLLAGGAISLPPTPLVYTPCSSLPSAQIGYMDFLDINGVQLPQSGTPPVATPGTCSSIPVAQIGFVRQWQIVDLLSYGPAIKQITVAVYSIEAIAQNGGKPVVVVTSYVENPN